MSRMEGGGLSFELPVTIKFVNRDELERVRTDIAKGGVMPVASGTAGPNVISSGSLPGGAGRSLFVPGPIPTAHEMHNQANGGRPTSTMAPPPVVWKSGPGPVAPPPVRWGQQPDVVAPPPVRWRDQPGPVAPPPVSGGNEDKSAAMRLRLGIGTDEDKKLAEGPTKKPFDVFKSRVMGLLRYSVAALTAEAIGAELANAETWKAGIKLAGMDHAAGAKAHMAGIKGAFTAVPFIGETAYNLANGLSGGIFGISEQGINSDLEMTERGRAQTDFQYGRSRETQLYGRGAYASSFGPNQYGRAKYQIDTKKIERMEKIRADSEAAMANYQKMRKNPDEMSSNELNEEMREGERSDVRQWVDKRAQEHWGGERTLTGWERVNNATGDFLGFPNKHASYEKVRARLKREDQLERDRLNAVTQKATEGAQKAKEWETQSVVAGAEYDIGEMGAQTAAKKGYAAYTPVAGEAAGLTQSLQAKYKYYAQAAAHGATSPEDEKKMRAEFESSRADIGILQRKATDLIAGGGPQTISSGVSAMSFMDPMQETFESMTKALQESTKVNEELRKAFEDNLKGKH